MKIALRILLVFCCIELIWMGHAIYVKYSLKKLYPNVAFGSQDKAPKATTTQPKESQSAGNGQANRNPNACFGAECPKDFWKSANDNSTKGPMALRKAESDNGYAVGTATLGGGPTLPSRPGPSRLPYFPQSTEKSPSSKNGLSTAVGYRALQTSPSEGSWLPEFYPTVKHRCTSDTKDWHVLTQTFSGAVTLLKDLTECEAREIEERLSPWSERNSRYNSNMPIGTDTIKSVEVFK